MGFAETGLVYALIGIAVGIALALREERRRVLLFLAGFFFWPVFAPFQPRTISFLPPPNE